MTYMKLLHHHKALLSKTTSNLTSETFTSVMCKPNTCVILLWILASHLSSGSTGTIWLCLQSQSNYVSRGNIMLLPGVFRVKRSALPLKHHVIYTYAQPFRHGKVQIRTEFSCFQMDCCWVQHPIWCLNLDSDFCWLQNNTSNVANECTTAIREHIFARASACAKAWVVIAPRLSPSQEAFVSQKGSRRGWHTSWPLQVPQWMSQSECREQVHIVQHVAMLDNVTIRRLLRREIAVNIWQQAHAKMDCEKQVCTLLSKRCSLARLSSYFAILQA